MAIFVDANVLAYATAESTSSRGHACGAIVEAIGDGRLAARCSAAVLEELWHLELRGRPPGLGGATSDAYELLKPLLPVDDEVFARALSLDASPLGSNDRIHAATCRANGIEVILSTDAEFEQLDWLRRADPLDAEAILARHGEQPLSPEELERSLGA